MKIKMKLFCDCGNEVEFSIVEEFGEEEINNPDDAEEKGVVLYNNSQYF